MPFFVPFLSLSSIYHQIFELLTSSAVFAPNPTAENRRTRRQELAVSIWPLHPSKYEGKINGCRRMTNVLLSARFATRKRHVSRLTSPLTMALTCSAVANPVMEPFLRVFDVVTENDKVKDCVSKSKGDADKDFVEKLEDCDSKNHQIITWICKTSTMDKHLQFGFETTKEIWDNLAKHYTIFDLSHQDKLRKELHSLKQDRGQAIYDFLVQMELIWDQLTSCKHVLKNAISVKACEDYRNQMRLV
ncbi:hypothetical protein PIB30_073013 [Stylosanthes scabra]|uniref:Retrotransposon gag domain-containing protein n=1 Tax=Stylosanthes scabra TaxID=79078 RepID=A0ABU6VMW4_9FABA|nr:hypothetical protein [Stylosanthes scabra]